MSTKRKAAVGSEDVVALLVSCIRNSNGKINWTSVASECGITTNSAFKRYKKVLNNHESPNAGSNDAGGTGGAPVAPQKGKGKGKVSPTVGGRVTKTKKTKERKLQPESEDEHPEEEDQTYNLESLLDDNEDQNEV
ncbi:hypothetical protein BDV97DRAFT_400527 [Delphinella strobiligena]|nr:hypothetical protein BDV97DRAFT_400527 [Delphinella strobiligena]